MEKNPKLKKHFLVFGLILLTSSLGIFVFGANEARALDIPGSDIVGSFFGNLLLMIQGAIGWLVAIFAGLAQGALKYTDLQNAPIVKEGWRILRDLVNMFFVLVLLAIAFATILRLESYGMKSLLPKLIGVALLINFSLIISGVFIDFSGVLTNFFLEDEPEKFFEDISTQIGLPRIQVTNADAPVSYWQSCWLAGDPDCQGRFKTKKECKDSTSLLKTCVEKTTSKVDWDNINSDAYWEVIKSLIFSIIFTVIAAFVFGALAFFLIVRILAIWFLLILVPLAWFFWILPTTSGLFTKWWNNFVKWVFFAPAAVFFIWLSIESWTGFIEGKLPFAGEKIVEGVSTVITDDILKTKIIPEVMEPSYFVQFLLACGMLIGSLIVAQTMSVYGARGAIELGKKWGTGTGRGIRRLATKPADGIQKGLNKASTWMRGSRWGRWTGVSNLMGQASRIPGVVGGKERAAYPEAEKKYKNWSSDNLKARFRMVNSQEKAAIGKILAERGDFEANESLGFSEKDTRRAFSLARKYGRHGDILKARPDFESHEKINEFISEMKKADMEKVQAVSLEDDNVRNSIKEQLGENGQWTGSHLSKMAETNHKAYAKIREKIIEESWDELRDDIKEYITGETGKAVFGKVKPKTKQQPSTSA